jgi:flagella basal body P-ring formation protein FlgA
MHLAGRAVATVEVATVTRTIENGGILKESDVQMERRPRSDVGRDIVTGRQQAVGLAVRGVLQSGRPIRVGELIKPPLVQRNDTVTLLYEVPGIVLTIRGKAADSAEGDVISVLNEQSKRTVQGTIVGPAAFSSATVRHGSLPNHTQGEAGCRRTINPDMETMCASVSPNAVHKLLLYQ